jgi:hypothetical protein
LQAGGGSAHAAFEPGIDPTFPHLRQAEVTTIGGNGIRSRAKGENAMAAPGSMRIVMLCAAALGCVHLASPVMACEPGRCGTAASEAKPDTRNSTKPLKLRNHMRKPVASSATRTVKRGDGEYRKVAIKRRAKPRPEPRPEAPPEAPAVSPAAAQAFASYEVARVRVVSPELMEEARLLADLVASRSTVADTSPVIGAENVQVVESSEVNDIDLKADTPYATSLDALSRDLAGSRSLTSAQESKDDSEHGLQSWLQRARLALGTAFAGLTTLVRIVFG